MGCQDKFALLDKNHELLGNILPSRKTAAAHLEHQNFPSEQCGYFLTAITYDKACDRQQTVY